MFSETVAGAWGNPIVPFGSDDIMLPQRLKKRVARMWDKPEVGICAGNIEIIDSDGRVISGKEQRKYDPPFRRLDFDDLLLDRKPGPMAPTLMFRRETPERAGGFDPGIRLEDVYIELTVTEVGYAIDILGEILARYRKYPTSTYKNARFMMDDILKIYSQFSDHPDYEQAIVCLRNSMLLKCLNWDEALARELLSSLPLKYWSEKILRSIVRLFFSQPG